MKLYNDIKKLLQSKNSKDVMLGEELSKSPDNIAILQSEIRAALNDIEKEKFDGYLRRYPGNKILKVWPKFYSDYIKK